MTRQTHRQGGMLISIIGLLILRYKGLLFSDISILTQWLIIYPFTLWGSLVLDQDHHIGSIPLRDYASICIHKILHLTTGIRKQMRSNMTKKVCENSTVYKLLGVFDASHRSKQTHSTLTLETMFICLLVILNTNILSVNQTERVILALIMTGITLGAMSHLFLDMLTPDGIWCWETYIINKILKWNLPVKLRLVPKFKVTRNSGLLKRFLAKRLNFSTGSSWETYVEKKLTFLTWVAFVVAVFILAYPHVEGFLPYKITFGR